MHTIVSLALFQAKMGFKEGEGLGKQSQGITVPVEASKQKGRRGLGLQLKGFEPADIDWNFDKERVCELLFDPMPCTAVENKVQIAI